MGQLRYERDFREKLNEREIKPKHGSWEELSARLNSDKKSKKPIFWWIGIAAAIVGGILIFSGLFSEPISEIPAVADAPAEEIFKDEIENRGILKEKLTPKGGSLQKRVSVKPANNLISKKTPVFNSELASIGKPQEFSKDKNDQPQRDPELKLETKIPEIPAEGIAEGSSKDEKAGNITDAEVDGWLAEASEELNRERSPKSFSENIDPNSLLFDVKMELEQSFREKIFGVLKEGYSKAKTAVANRN